ncbi:hypothetical protein HHI36_005446 [Cryptolaemus montrouzieri]|uniref:Uncharacterized protein n=1 Tax=Cryptolaemus montrouzieri TaxID=559131 RepID=A0ABD2NUD4_9CUCU
MNSIDPGKFPQVHDLINPNAKLTWSKIVNTTKNNQSIYDIFDLEHVIASLRDLSTQNNDEELVGMVDAHKLKEEITDKFEKNDKGPFLHTSKKQKNGIVQEFRRNLNLKDGKAAWNKIRKFKSTENNNSPKKLPSNEVIHNIMNTLAPTNPVPDPPPVIDNDENILNFTIDELNLKSRKESAPGMNGVSYTFYRNLTLTAKNKLLEVLRNL